MPPVEEVDGAAPNSPSALDSDRVSGWAAAITQLWSEQVQSEWKREKRRQTSLRYRVSKRQQLTQLHQEQDRLHFRLQQHLAALRRTQPDASCPKDHRQAAISACRLAIEEGVLRRENEELYRVLQQHKLLTTVASKSSRAPPVSFPRGEKKPLDIYEASKNSRWVPYARRDQEEWQVFFPNDEPSFYFLPFTRAEFDDVIENCVSQTASGSSDVGTVGSLFGWGVHHAPLTRSAADGSLIAHARFTSRIACSLDEADVAVTGTDLNSWSLLFTPLNWTSSQRNAASTQVLQQFDLNSHILVTSVADQVHSRYFHFDLRWPRAASNGKRAVWIVAAVADPESTLRHSVDEASRDDVRWISDGGYCIKLSEVNGSTIDVEYSRWARCESEVHGQQLFISWAQILCRWSQGVISSKLIESGC